MYTKLLAYETRSRYRTDARSLGAFIVTIVVASGIVAAGLPGISGSTAVLAYALCALTPVACAIAGLSFLGGRYMAEAFRSGLDNVPPIQV